MWPPLVVAAPPLGEDLGPPALLGLQPLPLPRCPLGGGGVYPIAQPRPLPLPPLHNTPGAGGPPAHPVEGAPPPPWCCPLPHQPEGDALKNIKQPLGGGGDPPAPSTICEVHPNAA